MGDAMHSLNLVHRSLMATVASISQLLNKLYPIGAWKWSLPILISQTHTHIQYRHSNHVKLFWGYFISFI